MKKTFVKIFATLLLVLFATKGFAQKVVIEDYNRSSIYTLAMLKEGKKMSDEIFLTYWNMESPEKYNDHDLSLKVIYAPAGKLNDKEMEAQLTTFVEKNQIAKRMVAKWFNRDKKTGSFDMTLIQERGNYNATQADLAQALQTARGKAMLADAGEQLIGNTFLIINDIQYVDKEEAAQKAAAVFAIIGAVAGGIGGNIGDLAKSVADLGKTISDAVAGFSVDITSHLYQLDWNDEVAATFYKNYYFDANSIDADKKKKFDADKSLFKMKYVGSYSTRSAKTVTRGLHEPQQVFRKVLSRAVDNNIVELQKKFPIFKVTTAVYEVGDGEVYAQIGLKEGVDASSKYEVLERRENQDGEITYRRVGVVKPVRNKIWDNRCMATEEGAENATLNYTTFDIVSGLGFYPGMLIREIR